MGRLLERVKMENTNFLRGFKKQADLTSSIKGWSKVIPTEKNIAKYTKQIRPWAAGLGALGLGIAGSGLGFMARSKFEDRHIPEEEKTLKDKMLAKAPLIGLGAGALLGVPYGIHRLNAVAKQIPIVPEAVADALTKSFDYLDSEDMKGFMAAAQGGMKNMDKSQAVDVMRLILEKNSSVLPNVKLRKHQEAAIQHAVDNNGSLMIAHATGTGKTLTGIAAFEKLKEIGKANKAIVVVPASLRSNFVDNGIKKFTNSSVATYGPKNEGSTKGIDDKSNATYNVISYDLFREHGDKILENTGADTLIMDEVHRARSTEGATYNKLRELRSKVKNAITLTGSVVNNEPNDIVPLMDITYGPTAHKLVSKEFFDKLFVNKSAVKRGFFNPKVHIEKKIKNKPQLAKYLQGKVNFIPHESVEADMPDREESTVHVDMTPKQSDLYNFSMSSVDPITRWKIRNNIPVGQKEAQQVFGKLMQARQISTDPSVLDETLKDKNPEDYSPKVKAVVKDLMEHLDQKDSHKAVIFGNLQQHQLQAVEKALKHRGIDYGTFYGVGNEGNSSKKRDQNITDFNAGKKRVLLLSGAGSEGLDLKTGTMLQMLEGHYNPEKIQQAEARIRRMGSPLEKVTIKRYIANPLPSKLDKLIRGLGVKAGNMGVDHWIYNIAKSKNELNTDFRDVLKKEASIDMLAEKLLGENWGPELYARRVGSMVANIPGVFISGKMKKNLDTDIEARLKQMLLDRGQEQLTSKKHYDKIIAKSKIDEKAIDAAMGVGGVITGLSLMSLMHPGLRGKLEKPFKKILDTVTPKINASNISNSGKNLIREVGPALALGATTGLAVPILQQKVKNLVTLNAIGGEKDIDIGIQKYLEELRKKNARKYKSSKGFVQQYETKQELGIDQI